jgi:hypothetical protein
MLDWIAAETKRCTYLGSEFRLVVPFSWSPVVVVTNLKTSKGVRDSVSPLPVVKGIDPISVARTSELAVIWKELAPPDDPATWSRK